MITVAAMSTPKRLAERNDPDQSTSFIQRAFEKYMLMSGSTGASEEDRTASGTLQRYRKMFTECKDVHKKRLLLESMGFGDLSIEDSLKAASYLTEHPEIKERDEIYNFLKSTELVSAIQFPFYGPYCIFAANNFAPVTAESVPLVIPLEIKEVMNFVIPPMILCVAPVHNRQNVAGVVGGADADAAAVAAGITPMTQPGGAAPYNNSNNTRNRDQRKNSNTTPTSNASPIAIANPNPSNDAFVPILPRPHQQGDRKQPGVLPLQPNQQQQATHMLPTSSSLANKRELSFDRLSPEEIELQKKKIKLEEEKLTLEREKLQFAVFSQPNISVELRDEYFSLMQEKILKQLRNDVRGIAAVATSGGVSGVGGAGVGGAAAASELSSPSLGVVHGHGSGAGGLGNISRNSQLFMRMAGSGAHQMMRSDDDGDGGSV